MGIENVIVEISDFLPELNGAQRQRLHRILLAYGAARAAAERERMRVAIARLRANPPGIDGDTYGAAQFNAGIDAAIATTRAFD